ncbi:hypothetical protein PMI54_004712 [Salmonella enterica]|nr:hypothetical protein [Salmonella enterica]
MLNLFHATTFTRGEQILCDGKIKCDAPPLIKWIQATTPDWIYLSDRVDNAVHWGNKVSVLTRTEDFFCIFKIILPPDRCYPDLDDLLCNAGMTNENANNTDLLTCLSVCHSCRTNSDLYFGVEVTHYTVLPVVSYKNETHPLYDVVRSLRGHIGEDEYDNFEPQRQRIQWVRL